MILTIIFPLLYQRFDHRSSHTLYSGQTVSDRTVIYRESVHSTVHIRRQDFNPHLSADQNIFCNLIGKINNRCHKCGHKFHRIIIFQICSLIGNNCIGCCMGLIKSIFGEINHFIIDFICRCLINSICNTSGNSLCFISVNKVLAFLFHNRGLLFGHCSTYQVASAQSITCQIPNDLHNLLLIDNTPISRLQNWLQLRAVVTDGIRTVFTTDVLGNEIHRTRAVKRNSRDHIFQTLRLQFLHEVFHSRTFKLEHTIRTAGTKGIQNLFIIIIDFLHIQSHPCILLDQLYCILDHSQGTKSQEVHFQKSQFFQCCHGELRDNRTV